MPVAIQQAKRMRHIYIVNCSLSGSTIFFLYYLKIGTIFGKKSVNTKYILIFFTTFDWKIASFKKNSASYYHKRTVVIKKNTVIPVRF